MFEARAYFDYNIPISCVKDNYENTVKLLYEFGYRTVAINQIIDDSDDPIRKKKRKGGPRVDMDIVPSPYRINVVKGCEDMQLLNRITIVFANSETIHRVTKSPNYRKYDIVAVLPTTNAALLFTGSNIEADICCFNPENKMQLRRNRKLYNQLIDKGYHFEIPYAPAIEDSTKRKYVIQTAHLYHSLFKSRNIIISSFAANPLLIRSPYDVINLALIFGLNELQSKNAIAHCGREVFINALGRKNGKSAAMFVEVSANNESVIVIDDDTMDVDEEPAVKKLKP